MELGESISAMQALDFQHEEDTCMFCNASDPPKEIVNDLEDCPDEDSEADSVGNSTTATYETYKFKNDAGKLGTALGGKPDAKKVTLNGKEFNAAVAAHHLIPGNASLKNSELFLSEEYLWKDGKAKGNIGYDINSDVNGVWSPGNYGVRPWGPNGSTFKSGNDGLEPKDFAFAAMEKWRCQFHDAHSDYSSFVTDTLDKLYEKLEAGNSIWCPEAKKKEKKPEEKEPIFAIVARLNTISRKMERMLKFPTMNWKKNIYTSRFVRMYMETESHKD